MNTPSSPFFRDLRMPSDGRGSRDHERFLLDTLAERRAAERPTRGERLRAAIARTRAALRSH